MSAPTSDSRPATADWRARFASDLQACREATLSLVAGLDDAQFRRQIHPGYSPIGWHLGHIAFTEALWLLGETRAGWIARERPLYAADGIPKAERTRVPGRETLLRMLKTVREAVENSVDGERYDERRARFIVQHEAQHGETIAVLMALAGWHAPALPPSPQAGEMAAIPTGVLCRGDDSADALDNERPRHRVTVPAFSIDRRPVTQRDFAGFVAAGGYRTRAWWSAEGWNWLQRAASGNDLQPTHWRANGGDLPVCGVNAYEAEAYARFVGKRLPSEAEWERAAEALGGFPAAVWEWMATIFHPFDGFEAYPYAGYSEIYFDGRHRVLKSGSPATQDFVRRRSFRNWYPPETREIFVGFRCASDAPH